jgi:MoxR-like ATPase
MVATSNTKQKEAYQYVLHTITQGEQGFLLIHGEPGTGKTFTAGLIVKALEARLGPGTCRACSYMWSAVRWQICNNNHSNNDNIPSMLAPI